MVLNNNGIYVFGYYVGSDVSQYGYYVILIAQFDRMIDRQIRSLIEYNYVHRKLSNFGIKGWLLLLFSLGRNFMSVKVWYPLHEKVSQELFRANKKFYSLYDTRNIFADGKKGN